MDFYYTLAGLSLLFAVLTCIEPSASLKNTWFSLQHKYQRFTVMFLICSFVIYECELNICVCLLLLRGNKMSEEQHNGDL